MTGFGGGHAPGTGRRGTTEFPPTWTRDEIVERLSDVARNPDEVPRRLPNGLWHTVGVREEVRIVVLLEQSGSIRTAFPVEGPGVVRNPDPTNPTVADLAAGRVGHTATQLLARLDGRLGPADRELYAQLHLAGEWDELRSILAAQELALTADERELLADLG